MTRYEFKDAPAWANAISDKELIDFCVESPEDKKKLDEGNVIQFISTEIFNTSNMANHRYVLQVIKLSNSDLLQNFSIAELTLFKNDKLAIHRFGTIREGIFIDKKDQAKFRIIDNESSSSQGVIDEKKSLHWVVSDLHIDDIFVLEYTRMTDFTEKDVMDKKYFFHIDNLPVPILYTKQYIFAILQNREETLKIKEMYFGDSVPKLDDPYLSLAQGERYEFKREHLQNEVSNDPIRPYLQIVSEGDWKTIANDLFRLYAGILNDKSIEKTEIYEQLKLADKDITLEDKIYAIIEYVQKDISYLYDAEVMHGHIPDSFDKTLKHKSADCKGKSILLSNLLSGIGVQSDVILINYSFDNVLPLLFPTPLAFNHMIVRIRYEGKEYFIDPTWNKSSGTLENRSQPIFRNFLPIEKDGTFMQEENVPLDIVFVHESAKISLKDKVLEIEVENTFKNDSADQVRYQVKNTGTKEMIKYKNTIMAARIELPSEDIDKLFSEGTFAVAHDDVKKNEFITRYTAKVQYENQKVFKFYYKNIDPSSILNHNTKQIACESFIAYPFEYTAELITDIPIKTGNELALRKTEIDNAYFTFSNTKDISRKSLKLVTKFIPKTYNPIKEEDLEQVKKDYKKIMDSNLGVGVAFNATWNFLKSPITVLWLTVLVIRLLIALFGN